MSHTIELTDEQYDDLQFASEFLGEPIEQLLAQAIEGILMRSNGKVYTDEEWVRHLGATEEDIAEAKRISKAH